MNDFVQMLYDSGLWIAGIPPLLLGLLALPFVLLARFGRIYPHAPLVILLLGPCALSLGLLIWPDIILVIAALDLLVLLVALFDLLTLPRAGDFAAERAMLRIASLRKKHRVDLFLSNLSTRTRQVWVRDDLPQEFAPEEEEFNLLLGPRSRTTVTYEFEPERRGAFSMERVHFRVRSRLGLWQRYLNYEAKSTVHVYPDMKQLSEYAVLARTNRLSLMGVRRTRRVGQDHDFERLRDYTLDDNYKHIDWRSTARRGKLTVKDFQTSQSQRLMFMIDCGRMMTNESEGLSLLDHAFNAMLMLSYVALKQGDSVGMTCFSDRIHNYLPPGGGMGQMNHLLHASYDRFPDLVESRYEEAFLHLNSHCRKRSLVILVTNLVDEVNAMQVDRYLSAIVGRHLPLGVVLRDHELFNAVDHIQPGRENLFKAAAAADILSWRHQVLADLEYRGVRAVDVYPEDMTAPLINHYLDIKARHLL